MSVYEDELFGRCSIIEHKESKELIITKEVICQSEAEVAQLYGDFDRRKNTFTNINLLRLRCTSLPTQKLARRRKEEERVKEQ